MPNLSGYYTQSDSSFFRYEPFDYNQFAAAQYAQYYGDMPMQRSWLTNYDLVGGGYYDTHYAYASPIDYDYFARGEIVKYKKDDNCVIGVVKRTDSGRYMLVEILRVVYSDTDLSGTLCVDKKYCSHYKHKGKYDAE